ncbi:DUF6603 domain-containing protein [Embleya sp. NPDC005971]|uniref:DUF6603 domain-containing protein n=1 Tax=Embleya sp. NPDC005971 TaxID=3156724 RepID=UPI0033F3FB21
MALSVAELRLLFASSGPDFSVSAALLGFEAAARLCEAYLGADSVEVSQAVYDAPELTVRGRIGLDGVQRVARVRFLEGPVEGGEPVVVGVEVVAEAEGWVVEDPVEAAADLSAWQAMGFSSACAFLSAGPGVSGVACEDGTAYGASVGVGFQVSNQREYVRVLIPDVFGAVNLSADFGAGLSLGSAETLGSLPFLKDLAIGDLDLPEPIEDVLSAIVLRSVSVAYDRDPLTLHRTEAVLALASDTPAWPVIPGFLVLDGFDGLALAATRESGPWRLSARLGARFVVADKYRMRASVALPEQRISAVLWEPADGGDLIGGHLDGTGLENGAVRVVSLRVDCDIPAKTYSLALALDTRWTPVEGITLEGVELRLAGQASATILDASLVGRFELAGVPVVLEGFKNASTWGVRGTASGIDLADFAGWFGDLFGESLPPVADTMELSLVRVSFDSARSGRIEAAGHLPLSDTWLDFTLVAFVSEQAGVRTVGFGAEVRTEVTIDDTPHLMVFKGEITTGTGTRLRLSWEAGETDGGIPLLGLAEGLGLPVDELRDLWPTALQPNLRSVGITYDSAARTTVIAAEFGQGAVVFASLPDPADAARSVWMLQVRADVGAGLSDLPLLAGVIPPEADLRLVGVRAVYASRDVPPVLLDRANELVAESGATLPLFPSTPPVAGQPPSGLRRGALLLVDYQIPGSVPASLSIALGFSAPTLAAPGHPAPLALAAPAPSSVPQGSVGDLAVPPADDAAVLEGVVWPAAAGEARAAPSMASAADPGTPGAPPAGAPGAWLDVGRSFGPLHVARLGLAYTEGVVWVMVDAAFTAGGFTMGVDDLGLGFDLGDALAGSPPAVHTRLSGLGVEFLRPPLRIAGALIDKTPPPAGFELMVGGMLVVQMPQFGVTAVGAYQRRTDGLTSLFVFGRGTLALGGPPPFRVTGVAAGFGYNSGLRIPGPDQVADFPLLGELDTTQPTDPMRMLDDLTGTWVSAREGGVWLAAGLDFTSFEFVHGRLLLILETGDGLTLALVGTARAAFPPVGKAFAPVGKAFAQVQLQLRVVYSSKRAEFAATALLYDSFVIDPSCVLTGGFAFHMWFDGSPHAGDFALTLGGYHPGFTPPAHYPQVPRLGFTWSLGSVSISGTSFFALTPSAVMAGGTLDVRYSSGALNAWLSAYAHLLISWKPFHFNVGIGVSLGASLKVLFVTLRGELSASLDLWGPPTGGRVTAKFTFVRVTVTFGPGEAKPPPLSWSQFAELLPPPDKTLRLSASQGLLVDAEPPAGRAAGDPDAPWLVDATGFTFLAETSVPATSVVFQDHAPDTGEDLLHIRPMQRSGLTSVFTVKVTPDTLAVPAWWRAADGAWRAQTVLAPVPTALWGPPNPSEDAMLDADERLLPAGRTGLKVTVPPPEPTGTPLAPIAEASIAYEDLEDVQSPLDPAAPPVGERTRLPDAGTGVAAVASGIATPATARARTDLHTALAGLLAPLPDASLVGFAAHATANGLPADPLLFAPTTDGGARPDVAGDAPGGIAGGPSPVAAP